MRKQSEPVWEQGPASWSWPIFHPHPRLPEQQSEQLCCETSPYPEPAALPVTVWFGTTERRLQHGQFKYTWDPNVTSVGPTKSFFRCGAKACVESLCSSPPSGGDGVLGMGAVNPLLLT